MAPKTNSIFLVCLFGGHIQLCWGITPRSVSRGAFSRAQGFRDQTWVSCVRDSELPFVLSLQFRTAHSQSLYTSSWQTKEIELAWSLKWWKHTALHLLVRRMNFIAHVSCWVVNVFGNHCHGVEYHELLWSHVCSGRTEKCKSQICCLLQALL